MFKIIEYIPANQIWATAENHEDIGEITGLVRGYNIEVKTNDNTLEWLSAAYINGNPEKYFNDEFHNWMYNEHKWTPTGRICFRGYGIEEYCAEEREYVVRRISDDEAKKYMEEEYNEMCIDEY